MQVQILLGPVIAEGESLSDAIDCSAGRISRITMPMEWDDADIAFQVSTDGQSYNELFRGNGDEYNLKAAGGRTIIVDQNEWIPGLWVKIRSGTYGVHVNQSARREFAIALLVDDAPA